MALNIGIFEREEGVMEAIRQLRQAGLDDREIRVIVKNAGSAPLIASGADVPVEYVQDIEDARRRHDGGFEAPVVGIAGIPSGNMNAGAGTGFPGEVLVGAHDLGGGGNTDREKLLREIGIPDKAAGRCEAEIAAGHYLLLAEARDSAGAPTIIRAAGAADVLH